MAPVARLLRLVGAVAGARRLALAAGRAGAGGVPPSPRARAPPAGGRPAAAAAGRPLGGVASSMPRLRDHVVELLARDLRRVLRRGDRAAAARRWLGSMSTGAPAVATAYAGTWPSASRMRR